MDSLVFLVGLGVLVAVIGWFIANELSGAAADRGLLAIRAEAEAAGAPDKSAPAARYRIRERPTPGRSAAALGPTPKRAYRRKAEGRPRNQGESDGASNLAEDF